jgi:Divergent InlB B-repeat domain
MDETRILALRALRELLDDDGRDDRDDLVACYRALRKAIAKNKPMKRKDRARISEHPHRLGWSEGAIGAATKPGPDLEFRHRPDRDDRDGDAHRQSTGAAGHSRHQHCRFGDSGRPILAVIVQLYAQRHVRQCELLDHQRPELAHPVVGLGHYFFFRNHRDFHGECKRDRPHAQYLRQQHQFQQHHERPREHNPCCDAHGQSASIASLPATNIVASGTHGGPFSPSSFRYMLSATFGSVNYSITTPSWLTASSGSGTVTTSAKTITFTVNSSARSLGPNTYIDNIDFYNTTNNQGNTTRVATLIVNPKQYNITVRASPSADGSVSGGGTFPEGTSDTVTATPKSGDTFVHWTENGRVVSTSESYTFTVSGNVTLVGDFR